MVPPHTASPPFSDPTGPVRFWFSFPCRPAVVGLALFLGPWLLGPSVTALHKLPAIPDQLPTPFPPEASNALSPRRPPAWFGVSHFPPLSVLCEVTLVEKIVFLLSRFRELLVEIPFSPHFSFEIVEGMFNFPRTSSLLLRWITLQDVRPPVSFPLMPVSVSRRTRLCSSLLMVFPFFCIGFRLPEFSEEVSPPSMKVLFLDLFFPPYFSWWKGFLGRMSQ